VFHKKINKKVNKQSIWNSENWLLDDDDVSKIQAKKNIHFSELPKNQKHPNKRAGREFVT
jgi:hypothetical protein